MRVWKRDVDSSVLRGRLLALGHRLLGRRGPVVTKKGEGGRGGGGEQRKGASSPTCLIRPRLPPSPLHGTLWGLCAAERPRLSGHWGVHPGEP